ncbi:MAG: DUF4303 domain-containing protein [Lachnospiraceae bacterium]|nr:DUF4303 domain-containing protein [Lachnospiraceae bacterium]
MKLFKKRAEKIDMKTFFNDIAVKIEQAVKTDMEQIRKEIGEEKIYAVALVTDSDCITLFLALNTYEFMRKKDAKYLEMMHDYLSEEDIKNIKEGTSSLTKWTPDEWGYSDGKNSQLAEISKLLYDKEEANSKEYEKHNALFFEAVTSAFKNLIAAKTFGDNSDEITYFISMSDDERTYEIEDFSAKLLNSESVCQAFLNRKPDEGSYTFK